MTDFPTMSIAELKKQAPCSIDALDHGLLAAYGSTEQHTQKIVVVLPGLKAPALLTMRGRKGRPIGVVLPKLTDLTLDLATAATQVWATYFALRPWPLEERRSGRLNPHVHAPVLTLS